MSSQPRTTLKAAAKRSKPGPSTLSKELSSEPPRKKLRPVTSLRKAPVFDLTIIEDVSSSQLSSSSRSGQAARGKAKEVAPLHESANDLWIDKFEPVVELDLAVHKRKIQDVRQWLLEALDNSTRSQLKKYRRILALTGPAGTGKTATLRVLARELGIEIVEWRNTVGEAFVLTGRNNQDWDDDREDLFDRAGIDSESLPDKFISFLKRASSCKNIFASSESLSSVHTNKRSQPLLSRDASLQRNTEGPRQLILLEDLPNMLHQRTQEAVHSALTSFLSLPADETAPIVIILSDAGLRGEVNDERVASGSFSRGRETIELRTVIPSDLLNGPFVTNISFNPIAETYLRKALQNILARAGVPSPGSEALELVIATANGDIRSAINALEFACGTSMSIGSKGGDKGKRKGHSSRMLLESVTRREQSMALFHLIGRILYNKRKGDPPASSLSQKKAEKEREMDRRLPDPSPLPLHLKEHHRRTSRVDIDALYADSPIDSGLLALYIQQNYTQYCGEIDECAGVAEALSWVDSSGGEMWYQANPHQFHLITLGTLHALPSPVPRRDQKNYKPAFFDILKRERGAVDAISDTRRWLQEPHDGSISSGLWSETRIALELGAILRAREAHKNGSLPPPQHSLFSALSFDSRDSGTAILADANGADVDLVSTIEPLERVSLADADNHATIDGGWLEDDEIEDV